MFSQQSSGLDQILHRQRPGPWQQFIRESCLFLARRFYFWRTPIAAQRISDPVTVVCISDTHNSQPNLPDGDVLAHAGDLTQSGSFEEVQATLSWIQRQPYQYKIVVAGNHDKILDRDSPLSNEMKGFDKLEWGDIVYLKHSSTTLRLSNGRSLRVFGSPYSPQYGNWVFQYPRSTDVWADRVPVDTDILITHAPPRGHLDQGNGCEHLLREIWRAKPSLHVFGHVHEGYGQEWVNFSRLQSAYERTVIARGGIGNLLSVVYEFFCSCLRPDSEAKSLLVNPAIAAGLHDEQRREPVVVTI